MPSSGHWRCRGACPPDTGVPKGHWDVMGRPAIEFCPCVEAAAVERMVIRERSRLPALQVQERGSRALHPAVAPDGSAGGTGLCSHPHGHASMAPDAPETLHLGPPRGATDPPLVPHPPLRCPLLPPRLLSEDGVRLACSSVQHRPPSSRNPKYLLQVSQSGQ